MASASEKSVAADVPSMFMSPSGKVIREMTFIAEAAACKAAVAAFSALVACQILPLIMVVSK